MWKMILSSLGLLLAVGQAQAQTRSVVVLLAYDHQQVSVPTVELYRRILDDVRESPGFLVIPMSVARDNLDTAVPASLGALAAFDRRYLLGAHPPARSYRKANKRVEDGEKRVIRPVQALVDTLAIDGALLLDCQSAKRGKLLKGCGLYYYDRARGQVVGSVTKAFQVGIRDARRWSSILIGDLAAGIAAEQRHREKKSIQNALAAVNPEQESGRFLAEIGAGGQSAAEKEVVYSPALSLLLGRKFDGYGVGLVAYGGQSSRTVGDQTIKFQERSLGIGFVVGSAALMNLEWDLGLSLAVANRHLGRGGLGSVAAQTSFFQDRRDLKLTVQPGLLWNLTKETAWGASFLGSRYFGLSQSQSNATLGTLQSSSVGMSIRLRTLF